MLDAYLRKGAQLPIEARTDVGRRIIEDAITSTLFTPVRFMAPSDVAKIISLLSGVEQIWIPGSCDVRLWPRFPAPRGHKNVHHVEPDIVVDLLREQRKIRTVIEIKWNDVLRVEQVEAQARSASADLRQGDTFRHLSIVKFAELEVFKSRNTQVREWSDILRDLKQAATQRRHESESVINWCKDAALFLEKLGIGTFTGFGDINLRAITQVNPIVLRQFAWADLKAVDRMREQFG